MHCIGQNIKSLAVCICVSVVGSRVIVLSLIFFEYFVQLAYSCTHLFSDTGHLLSTASPSLKPVRWTRGRCEVIQTQNCMHFILWTFSVSRTSAELLLSPRCRPTVFCLPFSSVFRGPSRLTSLALFF